MYGQVVGTAQVINLPSRVKIFGASVRQLLYRNNRSTFKPQIIHAAQRQKQHLQGSPQKGSYDEKNRKIRALNSSLSKCKNLSIMFTILQKQGGVMDAIHVSTAAVSIARILKSRKTDMDANNSLLIRNIQYELCDLILKNISQMNGQSITNCMWSFGVIFDILGKREQQLNYVFAALCERSVILQKYLRTQGLANSLWAMAKFQWANQYHIQQIVATAMKSNQTFQPQDISNILWALANLQYGNIKAIKFFVNLIQDQLHEISAQAFANVLWSLRELRYYDEELLQQFEEIILSGNLQFNSQEISNICLAYSDFGLYNKHAVVESLVSQFSSLSYCKCQEYSNFIYAMAILDCPVNLLQDVVKKMVSKNQSSNFENFLERNLSQIRLAQIYNQLKGESLVLPPQLIEECKLSLQNHAKEKTRKQNILLNEVWGILRKQYDKIEKRVLIMDYQIEINILVEKNKQKVAVMANSKEAYFINYPQIMLGRVQHRLLVLNKLGWKVVVVSDILWPDKQYQQGVLDEIQNKLNQNDLV